MPRTSYAFGIARALDSAAMRAKLAEACEQLSRVLGVVVFPQQAVSYRDLGDGLDRGALGFAWLPPLLAIELEDRKRVVPLALPVRRGTTSYHGAFITRRGAMKTLDDLRGKRAAWVDRESAAGYVVPRLHLVGAGFDVQTLFAAETFLRTHDAVVDAVVAGRADVGACYCSVDPVTQRVLQAGWTAADGTPTKPVEVLALTGAIPNDAVVAATTVPEDVRTQLQSVLTSPDPKLHRALDAVVRADSFRVATSLHYEPLRRTMQLAKDRDAAPPSSRR